MRQNAFRCDERQEFVNENLIQWLQEQGIELQITTPYFSSQNGAAEHLNRTLVELACAMLLGQRVPTFLWKYAIQHAAYLCERALAAAIPGITPYEAWHGTKPDVSHLREFGSLVYVLLQGQHVEPIDDGHNDMLQLGSQHNKRKRQYEEPNQGEDTKPTSTEPPQRKL